MKCYCSDIGLQIEMDESLIKRLYEIGLKVYPAEYGGILVGRYSDDLKTCFIEETILPSKHKSSRYVFERGKEGLVEKLTEYYNQQPKLIYIGEWHTHPDSLPIPSSTDKQAMKKIAGDDNVKINSPVLMILGISKKNYSIGIYIQFNGKLYKYEQQ